MLNYPNIDPVIFSIGAISIRWYGVAYVTGILLGLQVLKYLSNRNLITIGKQVFLNLIPYVVLGIVIGGRLGHVLLYDLAYYIKNPLEILMIWYPGMSFHGGLIGVCFSMFLFCYKYRISNILLLDNLAIVAPIGLFFGRIANFINGELVGRTTNVAWAMVFPNTDNLARHPSQLYEALFEGLVLFIIQISALFYWNRFLDITSMRGYLSGLFLLFYGIFRFVLECFREPEYGYIWLFTRGQFFTIPLIIIGIILLIRQKHFLSRKYSQ